MSAQRHQRTHTPRAGEKSEHASRRGSDDWEKMQGSKTPEASKSSGTSRRSATKRGGNPSHDESQRQNQSSWNTRQDPEHPERSADGGETEMRSGMRHHRQMRGNSGTNEQQSGDPESPDQPESADRGRGSSSSRRRSES